VSVDGGDSERAFSLIRQWGDPVLRERARPVERFDATFAQQVSELESVMRDADGAGLAATQVGGLQRVFVYRLADDEDLAPARVVVNPEIVETSEERETGMEGCLSLGRARVHVEVERPRDVVIEARDVEGKPQRIEATGMHARILQHEVDHLDGVLMLDRTTPEHRREAVRALNAGEPWRPPGDEPEPDGA
jgi:peptide deformylase